MSDNDSITTPQQSGVATFEVPLFLSVNLDNDPDFRSFSTEEREYAIGLLAQFAAAFLDGSSRVDVTSGLAKTLTEVAA